jgi:hypothetical protein
MSPLRWRTPACSKLLTVAIWSTIAGIDVQD